MEIDKSFATIDDNIHILDYQLFAFTNIHIF
jgi:hypothetical protein